MPLIYGTPQSFASQILGSGVGTCVSTVQSGRTMFDPFGTSFRPTEPARSYVASAPETARQADAIAVMTWNIKFAGGRIDFFFDGHGDRVVMTKNEVTNHLEGLARKIVQVQPDVLLLQEVDVHAHRSADVDMMQWLLDNTHLNYGAYASQWKARYIPRHGLRHMDDGNAILSRWPLVEPVRVALSPIREAGPLYRYFYLKRNLLRARVLLPQGQPLCVVNTHTEAFWPKAKRRHIAAFEAELHRLHQRGLPFIAGGDLNVIPPGSKVVGGFPDSTGQGLAATADHFGDQGSWLNGLYASFNSAIPLADYQLDNAPYVTHSTSGNHLWNRKLDYLFTNVQIVEQSAMTHQNEQRGGMETMSLSDHAPLSVFVQL